MRTGFAQVLRGAVLRGVGAHRGHGGDGDFDLARKARFETGAERERMAARVAERLVEEIGGLLEIVADDGADRRAQRGDLLGEIGRTAEFVTSSDIGLRRELRTFPGRVVVLGEVGLFEEQDALRGDVVEGVPAVEPDREGPRLRCVVERDSCQQRHVVRQFETGVSGPQREGVRGVDRRAQRFGRIICEKELMLRVNRLLDWPAIRLNQGFSW